MKMMLEVELSPTMQAQLQAIAEGKGLTLSDRGVLFWEDMISLLTTEAERQGIPVEQLFAEIFEDIVSAIGYKKPTTGAEMIAYWDKAGVTGTFADRPDSQEYARQLRHEAEETQSPENAEAA